MKRAFLLAAALASVGGAALMSADHLAQAQPAKGAPAAFERVREVMNNRFKDMKLTGDPDRDFAAMVIAHHEDLIFLARTQLEFGGDRQLRDLGEKMAKEQQEQISQLKEWQVKNQQPSYQAQPNQSPPGSGPLDQRAQATATPPAVAQAAPAASSPAPAPAAATPMVAGTVEKVDQAGGKVTLEHGPIPNLNMDGMTMVFRAADPAMLKAVKQGDKVQFSADRVNGQITVTKIQKGR